MLQKLVNGISLYQFESFTQLPIEHAFFGRHGGVSLPPYDSLNQANTVGDPRENIFENRRRSFEAIQRPVESIYDVWQVHGTTVLCSEAPRPLEEPHQKADAIFTQNPEVTLFMRFADCVPILLFDPLTKTIGIIHAGWQGTVKQIVRVAIETIQQHYHVDPNNLVTGIGPSIGKCHYQVGAEVVDAVHKSFGKQADSLLELRDGYPYFDLWEANKVLLHNAGVTNIQVAELCTACNTREFFSHRAEKGNTGRFAAALYLK
jgi:YfiH family protein